MSCQAHRACNGAASPALHTCLASERSSPPYPEEPTRSHVVAIPESSGCARVVVTTPPSADALAQTARMIRHDQTILQLHKKWMISGIRT